jgi:hypothetical protein
MTRILAFLAVVLLAGCSSVPPVREPEPTRAPRPDLPASQPPRRDSLHDLGGGRALLVPAARIGDERINECSGLAYAGGAWWTHNDSGDGPAVFSSDSPWFLTATRHEVDGAVAVDWEELAVLDGDLLACDIGDNARARDDLTIYRLRVGPDGVERVATYPVAYPDGMHDAEAVWSWDGRVHIVIKNRGEDTTGVYRFDTLRDVTELAANERNVARRIGTVNLPKDEQVTAADSSADGIVVLLTYSQALFFAADEVSGDPIASFNLNARQCEAVAWTASGIVFANEQRDVYMVEDPLGCELAWWLPPRTEFELPSLPKGADRELLVDLPVANLRAGESVRMGLVGGAFVVDAMLSLENDIVVSDGNIGTSAIVGFATDPGLQPSDGDRLFAVIVPSDRPLGVVPFSMLGPPANEDLTGVSVEGAGQDEFFSFRLTLDVASVFPDGVPERFLFQFVTNGFREGPDEPLLSGLDIYSLMRPFTWADVTLR